MLHLDGCDVAAAAYAARTARQSGIPVSLDVDTVYAGFETVLPNVDYLIASEAWVRAWTGIEDPMPALEGLAHEYGCRMSALTCGEKGALAFAAGRWHYSPGFRVQCVDTTGAGDAFHGAFCHAVLHGLTIPAALDFSNAAAALNCTAFGARGYLPPLEAVQLLLRKNSGRCVSPELEERTRDLTLAATSKR
jgi:sulfofructose kinase